MQVSNSAGNDEVREIIESERDGHVQRSKRECEYVVLLTDPRGTMKTV